MVMSNQEKTNALQLIKCLECNGYEAFLVGGCVRDSLHNTIHKSTLPTSVTVSDYDIATNATLDEVATLFKNEPLDLVGKAFGIAIVRGIEIATFRKDTYEKRSKPSIEQVTDTFTDASRRDFTINALYQQENGTVVDYFDGVKDIKLKLIRCVGDAEERFNEHPIRILRALYLASKLDYSIEYHTACAIRDNKHLLSEEPQELIGKVVLKALSINSKVFLNFFTSVVEYGLLEYVFPAIAHLEGLEQNPMYHYTDALQHTVDVLVAASGKLYQNVGFLLGAVYHDNGKGHSEIRGVNAKGFPNDLGHEKFGVSRAYDDIVNKLYLGKAVAKKACLFVKYHGEQAVFSQKVHTQVKFARRVMREENLTREEFSVFIHELIEFVRCDLLAMNHLFARTQLERIPDAHANYDAMLADTEHHLCLRELPINGKDLVELGFSGPAIGKLLQKCLDYNLVTKESCLKLLKRENQFATIT